MKSCVLWSRTIYFEKKFLEKFCVFCPPSSKYSNLLKVDLYLSSLCISAAKIELHQHEHDYTLTFFFFGKGIILPVFLKICLKNYKIILDPQINYLTYLLTFLFQIQL